VRSDTERLENKSRSDDREIPATPHREQDSHATDQTIDAVKHIFASV